MKTENVVLIGVGALVAYYLYQKSLTNPTALAVNATNAQALTTVANTQAIAAGATNVANDLTTAVDAWQ